MKDNKKLIDFIHVGDYKTATTYLQEVVFPFHPEIEYLGDHCKNQNIQKVLREIVDSRDLDFDAESLQEILRKNIPNTDKIKGISREALSQANYITGEHAKRNAQRLKEVFGDVKIIYVIREPFSMLESIYSQYIKIGGTRSFKDFFLDPMESKNIIERLKYFKNIEMYYSVFGKENVKVLLFEELKVNNNKFLQDIFRFIGCKDINFMPKNNQSVNHKLTTHGMLVARFLNSFIRTEKHCYKSPFLSIDKIIYFFLSQKTIDRIDKNSKYILLNNYNEFDKKQRVLYGINMKLVLLIEKLSEKIKTGSKFQIENQYRVFVNNELQDSNKILKYKYDLNVDQYGWHI